MTEQERLLGFRFFDEIWNKQNRVAIAELVATDCIVHDAAGDAIGPDGFYPFYDRMSATLSNMNIVVEDQLVDGDRICMRWSSTGKHTGDGLGIPPSNQPIAVTGITIVRVANGKLVEAWQNWDMYAFMTQIGAIGVPAPVYISSEAK